MSGATSQAKSRVELISALFKALDFDGDGALNQQEMRRFASLESEVDEESWADEYKELCSTYGDGKPTISFVNFKKLVDESDDGVSCSVEELNIMLTKAKAMVKPEVEPKTRAEFIRAIFNAFDIDRDGSLNEQEMRGFGALNGFEGTDAEWAEQYRSLCGTQSTVSFKMFEKFIDEDDDDVPSSVEELADMLAAAKLAS